MNGACPAERHATAELRARELEVIPDGPEQRHLRIHVELARLSINGERDRHTEGSVAKEVGEPVFFAARKRGRICHWGETGPRDAAAFLSAR